MKVFFGIVFLSIFIIIVGLMALAYISHINENIDEMLHKKGYKSYKGYKKYMENKYRGKHNKKETQYLETNIIKNRKKAMKKEEKKLVDAYIFSELDKKRK
jgi:uncharacterized membrane protein YkgB